MKKKLLAAALLAGFAGAASAQSSVTLYGVVDVGIQYQNIKTGSTYARQSIMPDGTIQRKESFTNVGMVSGVQNGSRWGLKGVEDLGNGLKANFVYESAVNAANGTGNNNFTRQATLGLSSSSWGALDLGRRTSPGTYAFSGIDPFGAAFGTSALQNSFGTQFIRYSNMVMYTTPNFSGFTGSIGYSFDTGMGIAQMPGSSNNVIGVFSPWTYETNNKTRALSIGLRYANGPLLVSAGYDRIQAPSSASMDSSKIDIWMLGGTYDFKVAKIHAAYGQQVGGVVGVWGVQGPIGGAQATPTANYIGGNNALFAAGARTQSWMVGLSAPVSDSVNVFGSVQQMLPSGSFKTWPVNNVANQTVGSVGATYSLSKRTNLYAYYSHGSNMGMLSGVKVNTFTVGMRHRF